MSNKAVANRYAVALFELAEEKGQTDVFERELELVKEVFETTPQLETVLAQPGLAADKKQALLRDAFQAHLSPAVMNTINLLMERGRYSEIVGLAGEYKQLNDDKLGIAEATVFSVKALSDGEKNQIAAVFAPKAGKRELRIVNVVDSALIGGLKVRVGDRVFDGSIQGQLKRLEKQLVAGQ
ncbi:F0F1 ATP synthase subunit delta [Shouchella clausii]